MKQVPIEDLTFDDRLQARMSISHHLIEEYRELIDRMEQWPFPPVLLYRAEEPGGDRHYVVDGWHRCMAAQASGMDAVLAEVRDGSLEEAFIASLGVNAVHGARRTNEDKRMSVLRALRHESLANKSDREIARICAVSHTYVAKARASLSDVPVQGDRADHRAEAVGELLHDPAAGQTEPRAEMPPKRAVVDSALASSKPALAMISGHRSVIDAEMGAMQATESVVLDLARAPWASKMTAKQLRTVMLDAYGAMKEARDGLDRLSSMIQAAAPYARCSQCMGKGCDACSGYGWITEAQYQAHRG